MEITAYGQQFVQKRASNVDILTNNSQMKTNQLLSIGDEFILNQH